jgi:hypothetical protein
LGRHPQKFVCTQLVSCHAFYLLSLCITTSHLFKRTAY